jgi:hypothetical protein
VGGEFCVCCAGKLKKHGVGIQERFFPCLEIFLLYGFFVQQFGLVANEIVLIERERDRERERERDGCGFVRRFFQVLECVQGSGWE